MWACLVAVAAAPGAEPDTGRDTASVNVGTQQQQQQQERRGAGSTTSTSTLAPQPAAFGGPAAPSPHREGEAGQPTPDQEEARASLGRVGQAAGLAVAAPSGPDSFAQRQSAAKRTRHEHDQAQGSSQGGPGDAGQEEMQQMEQEVEQEAVLGYVLVSLSQPMALLPPPFPRWAAWWSCVPVVRPCVGEPSCSVTQLS